VKNAGKKAVALGAVVAIIALCATLLAPRIDSWSRGDENPIAERHLERGIHLYEQGALADAQTELRLALRADPEEWRAPFYVGVIQIQRKRHALAIPYLERALKLNPEEPKIANALGVAYFNLGRLDMAKGYFRASLALDPGNADAKSLFETMAKLQRRAALTERSKAL